ncbi:phage holin family protein [Sphaerisporangium aureirubrum]|uniref:Phage holin family protein n=1 Tax=Sphaerisporangium aureirubrum TaxID=1544736 RepID=A0ABW1NUJ3_9ACTN
MAAPAEEDSLGALVAQASQHISSLIRAEIELAKSELKFNATRVGTAAALFGVAAFMLHLCLILLSFTLAYGLVQLGMMTWLAFLIVTVFYIVVAGLLALIGWRRLKGLTGMKRTARSLRTLKDGPPDDALTPPTPETAGEIGGHRSPVPSDTGRTRP